MVLHLLQVYQVSSCLTILFLATPSTPFTPGTPGLFKASQKTLMNVDRSQIRNQLASLPAPQNEYEATLPDEEEEEEKEEEIMDAEEIERQIREEEEAMEREELERRSQVMKRDLPRGNPIPSRLMMNTSDEVERMLKEEMNAIIRYEDYKYPSAESTGKYTEEITLPVLSHDDRMTAEMMILEEAGDLENDHQVSKTEMEEAFWKKWNELEDGLILNSETKTVEQYRELSDVR